MNKIELHIHTSEGDLYAHDSGAEIAKMYFEEGYQCLVITNHYFSAFFNWFKDELEGADHQKIIDRYFKGYYAARNEGEKLGITVLPGAEVRLKNSVNDYLIYGLEEKDFYDLPLLNEFKNIDELVNALPKDTCVVQAHPFRNKMTICDPEKLFGFEVFNYPTEPFRNEMAKMFALHYGKPMTSGSDFHGSGHLAKGGIIANKKVLTPKDLIEVLRSGEYSLIETKRDWKPKT